MRLTALTPLAVLVLVVLSLGFTWYLTAPDQEYLFDGDRGVRRPEVRDWWAYQLPAAISVGLIAMLVLVAGLRNLIHGDLAGVVGQAAIGFLAFAALAGAYLYIGARNSPPPEAPGPPTPHHPDQVFLWSQWQGLADNSAAWSESQWDDQRPELKENGVGLLGRPGFVPYDPFILDRISFVGLTAADVEVLMGTPFIYPDNPPSLRNGMIYLMRRPGSKGITSAVLSLALDGPKTDPLSTVRGQHIRRY